MDVKPKKYLGQHFLLDDSVSKRISESLFIENLNLLEIGPGTGALTKFLLQENIHLVTYELDQEVIQILKPKLSKFKVYNQDILRVNWATLFKNNFSVTGNFLIIFLLKFYLKYMKIELE